MRCQLTFICLLFLISDKPFKSLREAPNAPAHYSFCVRNKDFVLSVQRRCLNVFS